MEKKDRKINWGLIAGVLIFGFSLILAFAMNNYGFGLILLLIGLYMIIKNL